MSITNGRNGFSSSKSTVFSSVVTEGEGFLFLEEVCQDEAFLFGCGSVSGREGLSDGRVGRLVDLEEGFGGDVIPCIWLPESSSFTECLMFLSSLSVVQFLKERL